MARVTLADSDAGCVRTPCQSSVKPAAPCHPVERINKLHEGRPHIVDAIKNGEIDMVLNTPSGGSSRHDDTTIRSTSITQGIPCVTTLAAIRAVVSALNALHQGPTTVRSLQEIQGSAETEPSRGPGGVGARS